MTEPPHRLAGQWTSAGLGVHPAIGGGPLPAYARRPHGERLRAVLNPETESSRLVVIRGDALTGTSRTLFDASPGYQRAVAGLLAALHEAGATEAVEELAARAADAGMFSLFLDVHPDQAAAYRFGREPDGSPAEPWSWSEPAGR